MQKATDNEAIGDTLFGLLGCVSDKTTLTPVNLNNALSTFESIQPLTSKSYTDNKKNERRFTEHAIVVANFMCQISNSVNTNKKKKSTWEALQIYAEELQKEPTESNVLALSFVFGALALFNHNENNGAKAAASAISSTISRNKSFRHAGRNVANIILETFLVHASGSNVMNLNIITHFARAFKITHEEYHSELAADAILYSLGLSNNQNPSSAIDFMPEEEDDEVKKQKIASALSFACQIGPWNNLSPVLLVELAIPNDLWHAAEQVCASAYKVAISNSKLQSDMETILYDKAGALEEATRAVETLIDAAMEARLYRLADNIATKLYHEGGMSRYVEARLNHAYETISKVIHKRQLPIIERQVDRVDKAVEKIKCAGKHNLHQEEFRGKEFSYVSSASQDIREFVLEKLSEAGEIEAAIRLAALWEMEYAFDETFISEAAAARKCRYLQWDEVLTDKVPELISDPKTLLSTFESMKKDDLFGIDAEWDEDTVGVSVFQLASRNKAILIDIPALSSTEEGVKALSESIGVVLDSDSVVVGFSPRHDLSRLRASPCVTASHWISGTRAVIDAQRVAGDFEPTLKKLGLSRVCQHYLGKPLDKAEQCSMWSARPLSNHQRVYAALDAWVCVAIYEKIYPPHKKLKF